MYTPRSLFLALQVQEGAAALPGGGTVIELISQTSIVNQVVLALLMVLSVVSWAIILHKTWRYRAVATHTAKFLDVFRRSSKFSEVQSVCPSLATSPLVGLFQAGYAEINAQLRAATASPHVVASADPAAAARPVLKSLTAVDRALLRASSAEMAKLERRVGFLATVASAAPFIGLFGTVWGIMNAFNQIGVTGATNLATVGPGIADALLATAAGLFAAIPAVFFYNHFITSVKTFGTEMDDFALEFLNIAERNFT